MFSKTLNVTFLEYDILIMMNLLRACRPKQWIKNLLIFAALIFSQELFIADAFWHAVGAFVLFTIVSSSVYLINDIADKHEDQLHPEKKKRPIASGALAVSHAWTAVILGLVVVCWFGYVYYSPWLLAVFGVYFVINVLYSAYLKRLVIIDLMVVAGGFVLRAIAGAVAIQVSISPWLLAATFFAALFLVLGKRRHELMNLGENTTKHRKVLSEYSREMLDSMLMIVTSITIVMYVLYTMAPATIDRFGTQNLIFTVVFVIYGIFRTYYLIYQKNEGGAPTEMLLRDKPLQINILLWLIVVLLLIY